MDNEIVPADPAGEETDRNILAVYLDELRQDEVRHLRRLVTLYRATLCSSLELSFRELMEQCQDSKNKPQPKPVGLWWGAFLLLLQLTCFLAFYTALIWCCGPGREKIEALASPLTSLVEPLTDLAVYENRLRYNTFVFFAEYLYLLDQVPEPGTECYEYCVLNFTGMMEQLLGFTWHSLRFTGNGLLSCLSIQYQMELPPVGSLWYEIVELCIEPEVAQPAADPVVSRPEGLDSNDFFTPISIFYYLGMLLPQ